MSSILAKYYLSKLGGSQDSPAMAVASGAPSPEGPSTGDIIAESMGAAANPLAARYKTKKAEKDAFAAYGTQARDTSEGIPRWTGTDYGIEIEPE